MDKEKKGSREIDLEELHKTTKSPLSFEKFEEVYQQVAEGVWQAGRGEIWFTPKERRSEILGMTLTNFVMKYGEKAMDLGAISNMTICDLLRGIRLSSIEAVKGIGEEEKELIFQALTKAGFNISK